MTFLEHNLRKIAVTLLIIFFAGFFLGGLFLAIKAINDTTKNNNTGVPYDEFILLKNYMFNHVEYEHVNPQEDLKNRLDEVKQNLKNTVQDLETMEKRINVINVMNYINGSEIIKQRDIFNEQVESSKAAAAVKKRK